MELPWVANKTAAASCFDLFLVSPAARCLNPAQNPLDESPLTSLRLLKRPVTFALAVQNLAV